MRLVAALVIALTSIGCATVQPWERELLARPAMADELDPEGAAFDAHVAGATESALDLSSSGGGGCGCN